MQIPVRPVKTDFMFDISSHGENGTKFSFSNFLAVFYFYKGLYKYLGTLVIKIVQFCDVCAIFSRKHIHRINFGCQT